MTTKNNQGFSNILIIGVVLISASVGGYFTYKYFQNPNVIEDSPNDIALNLPQDNLNEDKEIEISIAELDFKGLDNCPTNECKNLELIYNKSQIELQDLDFKKKYIVKFENGVELGDLRFDNNYIYFRSKDSNSNKSFYSLNIKNGETKNLYKLDKTFSQKPEYTYLITGNNIYYTGGNSCGHVCNEPKESIFKTINSYDIKTGKSERINPKNLTDSGYKITDQYITKFGLESGRLSVWKQEGNKLILSFGQMGQMVEYFFEFDLKTKQVTNIEGNRRFYDEELIKKLNEYGVSFSFSPKSPVLLIQNGKIIGQK